MVERIYASMPGLEQEAAAINAAVDAKIPEIDACIRAINAYCGDSSLSGAAYNSSKTLFGVVHVTMLSEMKTQVTLLKEANNQTLNSAASVAPLLGEADSAELEREIAELEKEYNNYLDSQYYWINLARTYSQSVLYADSAFSCYNMATWCNNMAERVNDQIAQKREVLAQLIALNGCGSGAYSGILGSIAELEKLSGEIGDFHSGANAFTVKPLGNQALAANSEYAVLIEIITEKLTKLIKDQIVDKDGKVNRAYLSRIMGMEREQVTPIHFRALSNALDSIQLPGNEKGMEDFLECCYPSVGKYIYVSSTEYGEPTIVTYMEYDLTPVAMGFIKCWADGTQFVLRNTDLDLATGDMDDAQVQRVNEMVAKSGMLCALRDSGSVMVCEEDANGRLPLRIDVTQCDAIRSEKVAGLAVNERLTSIYSVLDTKDSERPYDYLVTIQGVERERYLGFIDEVVYSPQKKYKQAIVGQMINGNSPLAWDANSALTSTMLRCLRPDANMSSLMGGIALDTAATGVGFIPVVGDAVDTVVSVADYVNSVAGRVSEYMESAQKASMVDQTLTMSAEFIIARNVGLQISTNYYSDGTACVAHTNFPEENERLFRETMGATDSKGKTPMDYIGLDTNYIEPYIKLLKTNAYIRSDEFLLECGSYFPNYSGGVG